MSPSFTLLASIAIASWTLISSTKVLQLQSFTPDPNCETNFFSFGNLQIRTLQSGEKQLNGYVDLRQNIGTNMTIFSKLFRILPNHTFGQEELHTSICHMVDRPSGSWYVTFLPPWNKCPVPKKRYTVQAFNYRNDVLQYTPAGNFSIETAVHRGTKKICGATLNFTVVVKN